MTLVGKIMKETKQQQIERLEEELERKEDINYCDCGEKLVFDERLVYKH